MTAEEIVALYRRLDSIKAVSKQTRISAQAVRKILVSSGEYSSERCEEICSMRALGMSIDNIAAKLGITRKTVLSYLPYTRNPYAVGEKTDNAKKIKQWRDRQS